MIYKKQSLKSRVENLHSWLFSFIILMIVVNASVKAQDLDDRSITVFITIEQPKLIRNIRV